MGVIGRILSVIGAITLFIVIILIVWVIVNRWTARRIGSNTIIEMDLRNGVTDILPGNRAVRLFSEKKYTIWQIVDALERAGNDKRIKGLIARIGSSPMNIADIQEIRQAVKRFRNKGKKTIVFAETFGEFSQGTSTYYLASSFDSIYLQPSGTIGFSGLIIQQPFLKGTLEKLDVQPQLGNRGKYKSAKYMFTEKKYNEPHEEADKAVINSLFEQIIEDISRDREISSQNLINIANKGLLSAQEALKLGLIDIVSYQNEVYESAKKTFSNKSRFLYIDIYLKRAGSAYRKGETIALIHGIGTIRLGESTYSPFSGQITMGSETIGAAFRAAAKNKKIKAIIFRINSPGGSYVASDAIWNEVKLAGDKKPVIVSMGNVAGSGGYFIAMPTYSIVANRATITGSIGVIAGKMVSDGFWQKFGVNWDQISTNKNSAMWSSIVPYTTQQWELLNQYLNDVYRDFVNKAAKGRNLSYDSVDAVAQGRIWSGADAQKLGLVNTTGGLYDAINIAKESIDISKDQSVRIQQIPPPAGFLNQFLRKEYENSRKRYSQTTINIPFLQTYRCFSSVLEDFDKTDVLKMKLLFNENQTCN